ARLRWFVASVVLEGRSAPLLRSEEGDLEKYVGLPFDEQVSFLRHRFCGVLQRGSDRLWARGEKACQFVFVFEGLLPDATGGLTQPAAYHLADWMLNPPVAVFNCPAGLPPEPPRLEPLVGELGPSRSGALSACLGELLAAREHSELWEPSRKRTGG